MVPIFAGGVILAAFVRGGVPGTLAFTGLTLYATHIRTAPKRAAFE